MIRLHFQQNQHIVLVSKSYSATWHQTTPPPPINIFSAAPKHSTIVRKKCSEKFSRPGNIKEILNTERQSVYVNEASQTSTPPVTLLHRIVDSQVGHRMAANITALQHLDHRYHINHYLLHLYSRFAIKIIRMKSY